MKKIICLLLISVICLSLFGCNNARMAETWTNFAEFDGVNFDLEEYISLVANSGGVVTANDNTKSIADLFAGICPTKSYSIDYADGTGFLLSVFDNLDSAKSAHKEIKEEFVKFKVDRSCVQAIRINDAVVYGLSEENNKAIIRFAKEIGIPEDQIKLHKNNSYWRIARKNTDKSAEEIMRAIEEKGYTIVSKELYEDKGEINLYKETYILVSQDYGTVYQFEVFKGESAKAHCYTTILYMPEFYLVKENACHIYYSVDDGLSMLLMGVSSDTESFWNDIR